MVQVPENNQKKTGAAGKKHKVLPQEQQVSFFTLFNNFVISVIEIPVWRNGVAV